MYLKSLRGASFQKSDLGGGLVHGCYNGMGMSILHDKNVCLPLKT